MKYVFVVWVMLVPFVAWAAEPTAPIGPTAVSNITVATALRTVNIANNAVLGQFLAGTDTLGVAGAPAGPPKCGDKVVLALGTYAPATDHYLPAPICPGGFGTGPYNFVTIEGANQHLLPAAGVRVHHGETYYDPQGTPISEGVCAPVCPDDSVNMPTLNTPQAAFGFFRMADGASYYRLRGLNITMNPAATLSFGLLYLTSDTYANQINQSAKVHHIIVDQCLIHGSALTGTTVTTAVSMQGSDIAIKNSAIYNAAKFDGSGSDQQVAFSVQGPGPYLWDNNAINGQTHGMLQGDANVVFNLSSGDGTVRRNLWYRPPSWNNYSNKYSTGTATISANGLTVTLSGGTVNAAWADGRHYFAVLNSTAFNYIDWANGYPNRTQLISSVNVGANTITLASAEPNHQGSPNLTYKITLWDQRLGANAKNFVELKGGSPRWSIDANIMDGEPQGGQFAPIVFSARQSGGSFSDRSITNNWIRNFPDALTMTTRPTDSPQGGMGAIQSVAANAGNGFVEIQVTALDAVATGHTVRVYSLGTITEAVGIWPLTVTSIPLRKFTIPVPKNPLHTWAGGGSFVVYLSGSPAVRHKISNNLFENAASDQYSQDSRIAFTMNMNPLLTYTGGGSGDAALSTTGSWAFNDFLIDHNTFVSAVPSRQSLAIHLWGDSAVTDPIWKSANFYIRNNVWKMTAAGSGTNFLRFAGIQTGELSGSAALDAATDSSRLLARNAFYRPWNSPSTSSEYGILTGVDAFPANAILPEFENVGFSNYAEGAIANYGLVNLWTGTVTVSAANPPVLTSPSVPFPTTIVKGTPFKVDADGTFKLVECPCSSSSLTLAAGAYPTTGTLKQSTLSFKNWATDAADPGVNIATLTAALAGVLSGAAEGAGLPVSVKIGGTLKLGTGTLKIGTQ